ncbi:alpha-mannosidase [Promethearchaeum syntrophicum]|uniref:Alpha-mannosidase n=1 Tax=Promethearchaeum syntrophicum TaxID=2594042 RepID=A0A5B9DFE1_9ARCH|nr:glycoside hydrolase family 38 C-terminal domain-containing protein [Candidatus Prometheoarchaeum syntrophicum]QEE17510.1 alpha-mannosidase [Candidatus Prometheoarchaeum syntrophicum]
MVKKVDTLETIGHFSGSKKLDTNSLEETPIDDERTRKLWLEENIDDPENIDEIRKYLKEIRKKISESMDPSKVNIHMIGQSHIDLAWLWTFAQTHKKGIVTLEKVLLHIELFPEFHFAVSSPQLLAWIKTDKPSLFEKLKVAVKKGNIELVGGSWVESDCMMPDGEAFIRQRLYGMRFYRDEFNQLPNTEWFLDSFGYNVGLPQILIKSGAKFFWTSKLTWNKITAFPFINFLWESPDGSQILTCNFGQNKEAFDKWSSYKLGRHLLKKGAKKTWSYNEGYSKFSEEINPEEYVPAVGLFNGQGDGGHGPTHKEVAQMINYLKIGEELNLNIKWSTVNRFFAEVEKYKNKLPVWSDELYLETHRGTFTTHGAVKRHNRKLETLAKTAESLCSIISLFDEGFKYPYNRIEKIWKQILLNQFHDILPGSSIIEVYDDVYEIWQDAYQNLNELIANCFERVKTNGKNNLIFYNPLPWERSGRVFIPINEIDSNIKLNKEGKPPYARLKLNNGEYTICQPAQSEYKDDLSNRSAGWWTQISILPYGILSGRLEFSENKITNVFVSIGKKPRLANSLVQLELNSKSGAIKELKAVNLNYGKNLIHGDATFVVKGYKDKGGWEYPAWNLTEEYWKFPNNYPEDNAKITILDEGPVFSSLKIIRILGDSEITQVIRLFKDDPIIYCSWSSDWQNKNTLLKIALDTNTASNKVVVDEMFCSLNQSTLPKTPSDKARYEKIMHQYADLSTSDNSWGIALLNEGKYAFDCSADRIRLTLHRSPKYPSPSAESWAKLERLARKRDGKKKVSRYIGMGPNSCKFAYFPHRGGALESYNKKPSAIVKKAAEEFNNPIIARKKSENQKGSLIYDELDILVQDNVEITAFKQNDWNKSNSVIIRFNELCGKDSPVNVFLPTKLVGKVSKIKQVDLLERELNKQDFSWNPSDNELKFKIHKFEVITFEFILRNTL